MTQSNQIADETAAEVDMQIANNATWQDAFRFGDEDDTTWSFTNKTFEVDVKGCPDDATPLLALTSVAGQIVVDDATQRVLHFNVPDTDFVDELPPGEYVYDLIMIDHDPSPVVRTQLMYGKLIVGQGVTRDA